MTIISKRHHYIPQFYLENFTNKQNMFHIYLVNENRYKKNGDLFSPKSHFFEENGNSLFYEDDSTDFLEGQYKKLDDKLAVIFSKIKNSIELTDIDIGLMQFYIAHLFWRNPLTNELTKAIIAEKGLNGLGILINNTLTNEVQLNTELEKKLINNKSIYKVIKYWLPFKFLGRLFDNDSPLTISSFIPGDLPSLICDNPLILRNPNKIDLYLDDFILPLSRDKVLVRTKKIKEKKQNTVRILIDLLLLKQARTFVSTTDLKYIPMLYELGENYKSISDLREEIFLSLAEI
jgi:hypothetical protein